MKVYQTKGNNDLKNWAFLLIFLLGRWIPCLPSPPVSSVLCFNLQGLLPQERWAPTCDKEWPLWEVSGTCPQRPTGPVGITPSEGLTCPHNASFYSEKKEIWGIRSDQTQALRRLGTAWCWAASQRRSCPVPSSFSFCQQCSLLSSLSELLKLPLFAATEEKVYPTWPYR